jgi:hypothetical protein
MKGILTSEEKQYLMRTSRYLQSLGMVEGYIEIEMEYEDTEINSERIDWQYITHFSNNYSADIPEGLYPILKKVIKYADSLDNLNTEVDAINYQRILIRIDGRDKTIDVSHELFYYGRGNSQTIEYDSSDDKERFDKWMDEDLRLIEVPSDGILKLEYNGGGDSGFVENNFNPGTDSVPSGIEDWCYQQLENNFGGWEINEGSDGAFIFDFNTSTVTLDHTYNTEEQQIDTLYEESFNSNIRTVN